MRPSVPPALVAFALCACAHVDTRTAVEHERDAEQHRAKARQAEAVVRTGETLVPMPSGSQAVGDPSAGFGQYATGSAAHELDQAREEERAAHRIRQAADQACRRLPVSLRSTCPLAPFAAGGRVAAAGQGVRIFPAPDHPSSAETLRVEIDCALAEAQIERPADADTCPLYAPGATARVVDRPLPAGGPFVELIADDEAHAGELARRATRLVAPRPAAR